MKKRIIIRGLIGAPVGLAISTIITIIISLYINDGYFYPVMPELTTDCGSEINAVLLQAMCSLFYGAVCAGASVIWETDHWSILRQTATHLLVCSLAIFPIAYFMRWMQHSARGVLTYFGVFCAIYFMIWITQYLAMKKRIKQINIRIQKIGR